MHHRYILLLIASLLLTACAAGANSDPLTERTLSGGLLEIGDEKAPVSITLFLNHSSPYSQRFFHYLLPRLTEDFVRRGKVRIDIVAIAFKKYPESASDASALFCATAQGKGQKMNDLLFGLGVTPTEQKKQRRLMGIDEDPYQACLKGAAVQSALSAQSAMAASRDVTLVPTYFINETKYVGLPEYADLRGQMNEKLRMGNGK